MFCIKKKFLAIIAAAAMCLTSCGGNDIPEQPQETTKVENVYETLAEGQERGWKVKDVLKNDLEIDGIPISIPCTINDFLNALGDEYSIDRSGLLYNGELTVLRIFIDPDYDNIIFGLYYNDLVNPKYEINYEKGILGFSSFDLTMENLINNYPTPNEIEFDEDKMAYAYVQYRDNDLPFYIDCRINDYRTHLYVATGDVREVAAKK